MKWLRGLVMPATWAALALSLTLPTGMALGQARKDKPRVPPGVDPGGVTVAVIGDGIDYTRPAVAKRLARDGEGEIIGWDFVDNDKRPFEKCGTGVAATTHCNEAPLDLLTSPKVRIIPLRARLNNPQSLVEAVRFATLARARIVLVGLPVPPPQGFIDDAAGFHTKPLFIATVIPHPRTQPYKFAMGANFIVANAEADARQLATTAVAEIAAQAVECATDTSADAKTIRDCALGLPAGKP